MWIGLIVLLGVRYDGIVKFILYSSEILIAFIVTGKETVIISEIFVQGHLFESG